MLFFIAIFIGAVLYMFTHTCIFYSSKRNTLQRLKLSATQHQYSHSEDYYTESSRGSDLSDILEEDEEELYSEMQLEEGRRRSINSHNTLKVQHRSYAQAHPRAHSHPRAYPNQQLQTHPRAYPQNTYGYGHERAQHQPRSYTRQQEQVPFRPRSRTIPLWGYDKRRGVGFIWA